MSTALILGATGLLGREVTPAFAAAGPTIAVSRRGGPGVGAVDIRDSAALSDLCRKVGPDSVLLLAAYRDPDFCEENPQETRRLNVEPARALTACLPPETHLTFISTDYVFDGLNPPYHEDRPRHPGCVYGQSKAEAEDILLKRPNTLILRVPLLIGGGPSLKECGFIGQIVELLRAPAPPQDDVLVRFPTWTRDVARALRFLVDRRAGGVFHFSSSVGGTRYAWVCACARALGQSSAHIQPTHAVVPRKAARPPDSQLAIDKIRSVGYDAATDFDTVVRVVWEELPSGEKFQ